MVFRDLLTLSIAVEQTANTIILTDRDGTILYVNKRFSRLTGYSPDEAVGKNPRILSSGNTSKELYQQMWSNLIAGEDWRGEIQNKRKNGELYWESLSITPIRDNDGNISSFLAIAEDISVRKELENEIHRSLAEQIRINRELEQFNAIASHDLRGPLCNALVGLEILVEKMGGGFDKEAQDVTSSIKSSLEKATNLVSDLMVFCRTSHKGWQPTNIELAPLIESLLSTMYVDIESTGACVSFDNLPMIAGNRTLIRELFYNLIANAIKYRSDLPPKIIISGETSNGKTTIKVSDNGLGIPAVDLEKIFQPFQRGSNTSNLPGTGLGLSLCQRIVELHGGKIWVDSTPGQGSSFYFSIPGQVS